MVKNQNEEIKSTRPLKDALEISYVKNIYGMYPVIYINELEVHMNYQ